MQKSTTFEAVANVCAVQSRYGRPLVTLLATSQGSVYAGDGRNALHDLAAVWREVLNPLS